MLLQIDYSNDLFSLKISNPTSDFEISSFRHLISDSCDDYFLKNDIFYLSHLSFTRISSEIARFLRNHNSTLQLSEKAKSIIADTRNKSYSEALRIPQRSPDELITTLHSKGFSRRLNNNQLNNLTKISQFPAAATFSVPGAGKTTEALAFFFTNAEDSDHLLVVCPLNAMGAWDEQMSACCQNKNYSFTRLRGGEVAISRILSSNPRYMIISYQQFTIVTNLMYSFLEKHSVFMFLDESHRIKSGISGTTTQAILKTSCLPKRKLIMSGTPCPQSLSDLIPQFYFLYPDKSVSKDTVVDTLRPVFVRTTKSQLGIPPIQQKTIHLEMGPIQLKVYNQLRSEICRSKSRLSKKGKAYLRNLGKRRGIYF